MLAQFRVSTETYTKLYWLSELVTDVLTCGVLAELAGRALATCSDAGKFSKVQRSVSWAVGIIFTIAFVLHNFTSVGIPLRNVTLARDMLVSQAGLLVVIICGTFYYAAPIGNNTKGLVLGWGFEITSGVIYFAWASTASFPWSHPFFANCLIFVGHYSALSVWMISLWNYRPDQSIPLEQIRVDYREEILAQIRQIKEFILAFLTTPFKPSLPS